MNVYACLCSKDWYSAHICQWDSPSELFRKIIWDRVEISTLMTSMVNALFSRKCWLCICSNNFWLLTIAGWTVNSQAEINDIKLETVKLDAWINSCSTLVNVKAFLIQRGCSFEFLKTVKCNTCNVFWQLKEYAFVILLSWITTMCTHLHIHTC